MRDSFLVKKPLITEKAARLAELGQYVFSVKNEATKNEVKKVIKDMYKVDVLKVSMINTAEKTRRFRGQKQHKLGFKKAIVVLKKGQKINLTV